MDKRLSIRPFNDTQTEIDGINNWLFRSKSDNTVYKISKQLYIQITNTEPSKFVVRLCPNNDCRNELKENDYEMSACTKCATNFTVLDLKQTTAFLNLKCNAQTINHNIEFQALIPHTQALYIVRKIMATANITMRQINIKFLESSKLEQIRYLKELREKSNRTQSTYFCDVNIYNTINRKTVNEISFRNALFNRNNNPMQHQSDNHSNDDDNHDHDEKKDSLEDSNSQNGDNDMQSNDHSEQRVSNENTGNVEMLSQENNNNGENTENDNDDASITTQSTLNPN